jgi:hypothetical protein
MLITTAAFRCKEPEIGQVSCVIENIIRLDSAEFKYFCNNLLEYRDFIRDNKPETSRDSNGNTRCLLVLDRDGDDGVLINPEGYDYARYTSFMPGAKYFVDEMQETQTLKFYYPIIASTLESEWNDELNNFDESARVNPVRYADEIRAAFERENDLLDRRYGLAEFIKEPELASKVKSVFPGVDMLGGVLYGVIRAELREELSSAELEQLRKFAIRQIRDDYGENLDQRRIITPDDDIYISFLSSDADYFMDTERELDIRLHGEPPVTMPSTSELLNALLRKNYAEFVNDWEQVSPRELIENAGEIALVKTVFEILVDGAWDSDYEKYLLTFEHPLDAVVDEYCSELERIGSADMNAALYNMLDGGQHPTQSMTMQQ